MIDWTTDPDMRRRAQVGLNKGEAHHALKRAINFHQRGELRDRTGEGQHYRVAGLNLLAAIIIIYWNTTEAQRGGLRQEERRPRKAVDAEHASTIRRGSASLTRFQAAVHRASAGAAAGSKTSLITSLLPHRSPLDERLEPLVVVGQRPGR